MRCRIGVVLLLVITPCAMGAKLPEVPIQDFSRVSGTWKGVSIWRASSGTWTEQMVLVIEEDGSYRDDNFGQPTDGVMRIVDGKIQ